MRRLRPDDGQEPHRKALRYHMASCQKGGAAIHAELHAEASQKYIALKAKGREVDDTKDELVSASADADFAERALENLIRDLDGDLAKADREDGSLGAQRTVFPEGFSAVIDPEGDQQLQVLPGLRTRFAQFSALPWVPPALVKLDKATEDLKGALLIERDAEEKLDRVTAEEREARREVREQLESAHGRLRAHYKTRPALAERFFMRDPGSSRRAAKTGEKESKPGATPTATPAVTPAAAPATTTPPTTPNTTPIKAPEAAKPTSA